MSENRRYINYEDFELEKISYNEKQGLLKIDWSEKTGSKDFHNDGSKEAPAPELLASLDALKPHLARVLGLQQGWDYARENVKGAKTFDPLAGATQGAKDADNSVKVMSISILGEGETQGVKIAGNMQCLNGAMKVNCPVIRFRAEAMGIEQTIEGLVEEIRKEAYGFLFQNKRKQYTIEEQEALNKKKNKKKGVAPGQTDLLVEADKAEKEEEAPATT